MDNFVWRIEAHIWFMDFDEYAKRERELRELLGELNGGGSVIVFFRATPEYMESPGAGYDYMDGSQVGRLMDFCGRDSIDFIARVSRNPERELGRIRVKQRQDE